MKHGCCRCTHVEQMPLSLEGSANTSLSRRWSLCLAAWQWFSICSDHSDITVCTMWPVSAQQKLQRSDTPGPLSLCTLAGCAEMSCKEFCRWWVGDTRGNNWNSQRFDVWFIYHRTLMMIDFIYSRDSNFSLRLQPLLIGNFWIIFSPLSIFMPPEMDIKAVFQLMATNIPPELKEEAVHWSEREMLNL